MTHGDGRQSLPAASCQVDSTRERKYAQEKHELGTNTRKVLGDTVARGVPRILIADSYARADEGKERTIVRSVSRSNVFRGSNIQNSVL